MLAFATRLGERTHTVVGGIFLSSDHLFGVEKTPVGTRPYFINDIGLEIYIDCTRDIFSLA